MYNDKRTKSDKIKGSYVYAVLVFLICAIGIFYFAEIIKTDKNIGGSVDAFEKAEQNYMYEAYESYIKDPENVNVFLILFERGCADGELR